MEACGGLEYWEITFVCANTVTFLCKTKDLRCYNETRNKWQNRELTVKAWNDIQVFLLNNGFHSLSSILETSSFNHITSLITTEALKNLTMSQKSTKNNSKNCNNNNNSNINVNNVKNTKPKKEPSLINQIGLALREKIKTDEMSQKIYKNESQLELENIAFGKTLTKVFVNGKKVEFKFEKSQHKERSANPKSGPVCSLHASSKAPNQILSSSKKIEMLKTALPEKKIEPQVQDEKSKAEKKKEKKQRQKEKKREVNGDKIGEVETEEDDAKLEIENERSNESLENLQEECRRLKDIIKNGLLEKAKEKKIESKPAKKEVVKKTVQDKTVVDENATDEVNEPEELDESKEDSMADDIEFDDKEMPAFIKSSLHHKSGKKEEVKLPKKGTKKEKVKASWVPCHNSDEEDLKSIIMALKTDKACLDKACEATMKGKWKLAVACFTKAIEMQPFNMGHYLNRCFYHLRTNAYDLALNDALYVTQKSDNVYQVALANFRAGQVWYAKKNFDKAEKCMSESVELFPDNLTFLRELLYIRIKQLVAMGFPWEATIQVLHKTDSFADACNELSQGKITGGHEPPLISITRDSEIYFSDDEDDVDYVESLTNLTLNHSKRKTSATNKNLDNKFVTSNNSPLRKKVNNPKNVLREQNTKALPVIKDPVINYKDYEDKVLFLGNLTSSVTVTQIKKKFNCYGKILSIVQPPGVNYAFVNFENPIPLKDVLTKESDCKINDVKITVRPKPKKR